MAATGEIAPERTMDYEKILDYFTNTVSCSLYDRQCNAIRRIAKHNGGGFAMSTLHYVNRLLTIADDNVAEGIAQFEEPLLELLTCAARPFQLEASNDPQKYAEVVCDTTVVISNLLLSSSKGVRAVAASVLLSMLEQDEINSSSETPESDEVVSSSSSSITTGSGQYSTQTFFQRSGCISIIVGALQDFAFKLSEQSADHRVRMSLEQEAEVLPLLKVVNELAKNDDNARSLIEEGAPCVLVDTLVMRSEIRSPVAATVIDALWNLLETPCESEGEAMGKARARNMLTAKHVVTALGQILEILFDQGYRKSDKELRNEVLILLMILSDEEGSSNLFLDSGILDTALTYAAAAEIERPTPGDVHNYATFSEADFELKRLLWRFLVAVAESGCKQVRVRVAQSPLIKTLLMYIDFEAVATCVAIKRWSLVQMKILQEDALVALQSLALLCPGIFKENDGHKTTMAFLKDQTSSLLPDVDTLLSEGVLPMGGMNGSVLSMGSSFTEGGVDDALLRNAVLVLGAAATTSDFSKALGAMGAIEYFLAIFQCAEGMDGTRNAAVDALANLCEASRPNVLALHKYGGIQALCSFLNSSLTNSLADFNFLISVTHLVWICISASKRCRRELVACDGVDVLLSMLEVCPSVMRSQVLGCLSDLLRGQDARVVFLAWRSPRTKKPAVSMLLEMWVHEEERQEVARSVSVESKEGTEEAGGDDSDIRGGATYPGGGSVTSTAVLRQSHSTGHESRLRRALNLARRLDATATGEQQASASVLGTAGLDIDVRAKLWSALKDVLPSEEDVVGAAAARVAGSGSGDSAGGRASGGQASVGSGMSTEALVALAVVSRYAQFRKGDAWVGVKRELEAGGILPIEPDNELMNERIAKADTCADEARRRQLAHVGAHAQADQDGVNAFYSDLLARSKAKDSAPKKNLTMAERKRRKEMKAKMLEKSQELAGEDSSSVETKG